jgi:hypothetical protein
MNRCGHVNHPHLSPALRKSKSNIWYALARCRFRQILRPSESFCHNICNVPNHITPVTRYPVSSPSNPRSGLFVRSQGAAEEKRD